jgi:hypothetical protein
VVLWKDGTLSVCWRRLQAEGGGECRLRGTSDGLHTPNTNAYSDIVREGAPWVPSQYCFEKCTTPPLTFCCLALYTQNFFWTISGSQNRNILLYLLIDCTLKCLMQFLLYTYIPVPQNWAHPKSFTECNICQECGCWRPCQTCILEFMRASDPKLSYVAVQNSLARSETTVDIPKKQSAWPRTQTSVITDGNLRLWGWTVCYSHKFIFLSRCCI